MTVSGRFAMAAPVSSFACTVKLAEVPVSGEALLVVVSSSELIGGRPKVAGPCEMVTAKVRPRAKSSSR
jgi:hypothetical protein